MSQGIRMAFGAVVAAAVVATSAGSAAHAQATTAPQPVVVANSQVFDMTSSTNGRTYRIFIRTPTTPAPAEGYPVIYVLDGNWYFNAVADAANQRVATWPPDTIVVGIGYPDGMVLPAERMFDLTPVTPVENLPPPMRNAGVRSGGADAFRRFLIDELKPMIAGRIAVDARCEILFGHSFGGLFTLETLFREPDAFDTFAAASPSIMWNANGVLRDEAAFTDAVRQGRIASRLIMPAAEGEPEIVNLAAALFDRLSVFEGQGGFSVQTVVYPGEFHGSVGPAAGIRALDYGRRPCRATPPTRPTPPVQGSPRAPAGR